MHWRILNIFLVLTAASIKSKQSTPLEESKQAEVLDAAHSYFSSSTLFSYMKSSHTINTIYNTSSHALERLASITNSIWFLGNSKDTRESIFTWSRGLAKEENNEDEDEYNVWLLQQSYTALDYLFNWENGVIASPIKHLAAMAESYEFTEILSSLVTILQLKASNFDTFSNFNEIFDAILNFFYNPISDTVTCVVNAASTLVIFVFNWALFIYYYTLGWPISMLGFKTLETIKFLLGSIISLIEESSLPSILYGGRRLGFLGPLLCILCVIAYQEVKGTNEEIDELSPAADEEDEEENSRKSKHNTRRTLQEWQKENKRRDLCYFTRILKKLQKRKKCLDDNLIELLQSPIIRSSTLKQAQMRQVEEYFHKISVTLDGLEYKIHNKGRLSYHDFMKEVKAIHQAFKTVYQVLGLISAALAVNEGRSDDSVGLNQRTSELFELLSDSSCRSGDSSDSSESTSTFEDSKVEFPQKLRSHTRREKIRFLRKSSLPFIKGEPRQLQGSKDCKTDGQMILYQTPNISSCRSHTSLLKLVKAIKKDLNVFNSNLLKFKLDYKIFEVKRFQRQHKCRVIISNSDHKVVKKQCGLCAKSQDCFQKKQSLALEMKLNKKSELASYLNESPPLVHASDDQTQEAVSVAETKQPIQMSSTTTCATSANWLESSTSLIASCFSENNLHKEGNNMILFVDLFKPKQSSKSHERKAKNCEVDTCDKRNFSASSSSDEPVNDSIDEVFPQNNSKQTDYKHLMAKYAVEAKKNHETLQKFRNIDKETVRILAKVDQLSSLQQQLPVQRGAVAKARDYLIKRGLDCSHASKPYNLEKRRNKDSTTSSYISSYEKRLRKNNKSLLNKDSRPDEMKTISPTMSLSELKLLAQVNHIKLKQFGGETAGQNQQEVCTVVKHDKGHKPKSHFHVKSSR